MKRLGEAATPLWCRLKADLVFHQTAAFDYRWRPVAADQDDDFVLDTAIDGAREDDLIE